MKAIYDRVNSDIFLKIDTNKKYKDDYKTHMLSENKMSGIIPYTVEEKKDGSVYRYKVSGMISMKNKFLDRCIEKEDMIFFIQSLSDAVKDVKKYMLNADEILLYPELIFWDKDKWKFCYFPFKGKSFEDNFVRIKDFFVKRINNKDTDGIIFFHKMHKTTLIKPFTMDEVLSIASKEKKAAEVKPAQIYNIEPKEIKMVCETPEDNSLTSFYKRRRKNKDSVKEEKLEDDKNKVKENKKLWGSWG